MTQTRALTRQTLYQAYVITRHAGGEFNMVQTPADIPSVEDSVEFDPAAMRALYDRGVEVGRTGAWAHEPDSLDPLLRLRR